MKIWVTADVLITGICEYEVDGVNEDNLVAGPYAGLFGRGVHWHTTREAAVNCAEYLRKNKIAPLKEEIEHLQEMKF